MDNHLAVKNLNCNVTVWHSGDKIYPFIDYINISHQLSSNQLIINYIRY